MKERLLYCYIYVCDLLRTVIITIQIMFVSFVMILCIAILSTMLWSSDIIPYCIESDEYVFNIEYNDRLDESQAYSNYMQHVKDMCASVNSNSIKGDPSANSLREAVIRFANNPTARNRKLGFVLDELLDVYVPKFEFTLITGSIETYQYLSEPKISLVITIQNMLLGMRYAAPYLYNGLMLLVGIAILGIVYLIVTSMFFKGKEIEYNDFYDEEYYNYEENIEYEEYD